MKTEKTGAKKTSPLERKAEKIGRKEAETFASTVRFSLLYLGVEEPGNFGEKDAERYVDMILDVYGILKNDLGKESISQGYLLDAVVYLAVADGWPENKDSFKSIVKRLNEHDTLSRIFGEEETWVVIQALLEKRSKLPLEKRQAMVQVLKNGIIGGKTPGKS